MRLVYAVMKATLGWRVNFFIRELEGDTIMTSTPNPASNPAAPANKADEQKPNTSKPEVKPEAANQADKPADKVAAAK
jgi:hypothetical protein